MLGSPRCSMSCGKRGSDWRDDDLVEELGKAYLICCSCAG
jgi:hypothetical protein